MYSLIRNKLEKPNLGALITFALVIILLVASLSSLSYADVKVGNRYDTMANSSAGVITTHTIGFTYTDTITPVGSVLYEFCSNSPLIADSCTAPTGMDLSGASLASQSGLTGFNFTPPSAPPATGSNSILMTMPTATAPGGSYPPGVASQYVFTGIKNPTTLGEFYLRIETFSSMDGTGTPIEDGGIALATTPSGLTVTSIVPPYLTFCGGNTISNLDCSTASGDQINFGNFSSSKTSSDSSQFMVATNAKQGYTVIIDGDTLTSGNNIIPALASPSTSKKSISQFGLNLTANSTPQVGSGTIGPGIGAVEPTYGESNNFLFNAGDLIAHSTNASDYTKYTVSYVVNVNSSQPVGIYATTMTYICLANF